MKKLLSFLNDSDVKKGSIIGLAVLQLGISILTISLSQILKMGIDSIQFSNRELLKVVGVLALVSTVLLVVSDTVYKIYLVNLKNATEFNLQIGLLYHFINIRKQQLDKFTSGKIITLIINNASHSIKLSLSSIEKLFKGFLLLFWVVFT